MSNSPLMALNSKLEAERAALEACLRDNFASHVPMIPKISSHLLGAGGKRMRPLLTIAVANACNPIGDSQSPDFKQSIIGLAAAIEYLHSASLLHDDVVDTSPYRRGKQTANDLWGNQAAVLVGDYLFAVSFQLMTKYGNLEVMQVLANATAQLAEGEVMELTASRDIRLPIANYLQMITAKTATLFSAAAKIGAIAAKVDKDIAEAFADYGLNLGIAFQLIDDIMDYHSTQSEMGKVVGNDFREGKITLPILLLWQSASQLEQEMLDHLFYPDHQRGDEEMQNLFILLNKYDILNQATNFAESYVAKAVETMERLILNNQQMPPKLDNFILQCLKDLAPVTLHRMG